MTARWSWIGPRDEPRDGVRGEVAPVPVIAAAWHSAWLLRAVLVAFAATTVVAYGQDHWQAMRDTYAVIVVDGQPTVVEEGGR